MRYSLALITLMGAAAADLLPAQVTLQVFQGTAWTTSLSMSAPRTMSFRWKWDATSPPSTAIWQITYSTPAASPPIAQSGTTPVPLRQAYAQFSLAVPAGAPSRFHVRIRSAAGTSAWIPVVVGEGIRQEITRSVSPPPPSEPVAGSSTLTALYLPDITCQLRAERPRTSDDVSSSYLGGFMPVSIGNGETHPVPDWPLPPDVTYILWVENKGRSIATVPVVVSTWIDGVRDLNRSTSFTLTPGQMLSNTFKSANGTGWEDHRVTIIVRAVADPNGTVKELSETNNLCNLTFSLYTKTAP